MTKPRIFVSSTYYDLKHIRSSLKAFITDMGYEPILFENGDIPYKHKSPLDSSCYEEINTCHILILIIGGRYGSPSSESVIKENDEKPTCPNYHSVTMQEYRTAREYDIPIYIFVEKNVYSEYRTYRENKDAACEIKYAYVDNVNVFKLIDDISSQSRNNQIRDFDKFEDISNWLKEQWAGLFADYLLRERNEKSLEDMSAKIEELSQVTATLREYTESIMRKVVPDEYKEIIETQNEKMELLKRHFFASDRAIGYILRQDTKLNVEKLYSEFKTSKSFEEFVNNIGVDDELKNKFMEHRALQKDYDRLRLRLIDLDLF
ncbi:DUF4062 domain-containing protein [Methanococcoides sp. FTZ1]|uniref:DUF4062 domain-containing protein n=1 Tax=Methanococcoides sp. FTZ1 TaxID=3439061 RepID=UPI003F86E0AB